MKIILATKNRGKIKDFEKLTDESSWGKPFAALLGALKVQRELEIPAIGGKDSMSGTFMDINVPPALISFAVEAMDAGNVISTEFKRANSNTMKTVLSILMHIRKIWIP